MKKVSQRRMAAATINVHIVHVSRIATLEVLQEVENSCDNPLWRLLTKYLQINPGGLTKTGGKGNNIC